eukprot:TRINITY_DN33889_c0_g1_i1.p1 TRINITY_DN33889_c0_g1~~TRINITY_DN33889_c0_g1_i1.p1  ORF type:complete len:445 (+),score=93.69 TRINITY_DN33889_c0_g1_i1:37-1371(+)
MAIVAEGDLTPDMRSVSDAASSVVSPEEVRLHAFGVFIKQQQEYIEYLQELLVDHGYTLPSHSDIMTAEQGQAILDNIIATSRTGRTPHGQRPDATGHTEAAHTEAEQGPQTGAPPPQPPTDEIKKQKDTKRQKRDSVSSLKSTTPTPRGTTPRASLDAAAMQSLQEPEKQPQPEDKPTDTPSQAQAQKEDVVSMPQEELPKTPAEQPIEKPAPLQAKSKSVQKKKHRSSEKTPKSFKTPRKPLENHQSPAALEPAPAFDLPSSGDKVHPNAVSTPYFPMTPLSPPQHAVQDGPVILSSQPMPPPFARQVEGHDPVALCWCYLKAPPVVPGGPPLYKKRLLRLEGDMVTFSSANGGKLTPLEAVPLSDILVFGSYKDATQVMSLGVSFYMCTRVMAWIGIATEGDVLGEWLEWAANQPGIDASPVSAPLPVEPNYIAISPQRVK